ncbi:uncharacterized protein LOC122246870 [Penaeus japonicus]|uniref:uncharacterized protein LOC122246870 n=1 Tax=Penaeus japonicus TaxID=27405 RepID=UPI001C70B247|nr:uncharacterized protein LOC122246870 [Penaeus japonicus]
MANLTFKHLAVAMAALVVAVAAPASAERISECDFQQSFNDSQMVDVHCNCMQRLRRMNLTIAQLTIDHRDCPNKGLELNWPVLETLVAPASIILKGAHVYFARHSPDRQWNSSIVSLEFHECSFKTLPSYAFGELKLLETLRISQSSIDIIQTGTYSNLNNLRLIEIARSTVKKIQERSFTNLPALEDLALVYTTIGEISSEAVVLPRRYSEEETRCSNLGRSISYNKDILDGIMGRQLPSNGNLSLPEYGTRFLLFKNNIEIIRTLAINTEALGFLIAGGNHFETIESGAFSMELYNECEITAALFVGNVFKNLRTEALVGLRGRDGAAYQTFIALANNTFHQVDERGFMLSKNLVIFTVEENRFMCACDGFDWILSNAESQYQQELEKELVLKGTCMDGTNLISFTSLCTDNGEETTTARPVESTQETQQSSGSEAPVSSVVVTTSTLLTVTICMLFA